MFYYPTVLKRHSGCFSTIWLVATKGIRVPRRDFLKVNVKSTCDDIVNYLLERVPPPRPDLPRPRFSLYLSSQLQYGVVLVFHRQCVIFLEEIQSVVGQLAKQRTSQKIDMDEHSRLALDNPDALSFLEEVEGAPDPLFGVMYMHDAIHSPTTLIQMGKEFLGESSPEHPEQTSPSVDAALDNGITASPQSITLREIEPVVIPIAEFGGVELLDQHPFTIDLLLDQTDNFPEGDLEIPREEETAGDQEREIEREADPEREGTKEPTASTLELQPTATLSGEEAMLLPEEESAEILRPIPDQLTPTSVPPVPSPPPPPAARERERPTLELEDVPPAEVREKRKRQLIFFDPETQIPQAELQQDIDNPQAHTRQPTLSVPSPHRILPAAELFNKPCTFLPKEVEFLWRRAATIRPLSGSDLQLGERGPESTDSEKERQREMVEAAQIDERLELSPKEVPRDVAPQSEMFDISAHGSLPLEASDQREMSREMSPMYASERDETPVSRSVSTLQDIPEVPDEVLQRAAAESPRLLPELTEQEMPPVLFHSLLPQDADRRTVSDIFQRLLETLSTRKVYAEQSEPYGRIWILPGSNFDETVQTLGF